MFDFTDRNQSQMTETLISAQFELDCEVLEQRTDETMLYESRLSEANVGIKHKTLNKPKRKRE